MHEVSYFLCLKHIIGLVGDAWILLATLYVIVFTSEGLQVFVAEGVDVASV
jgi:hypothetical protein